MLTPRKFLDLIVLDHQFTLMTLPPPGFAQTAKIVNMSCSCGWSTGRAVPDREMNDGYSEVLTSEWVDREQLQHLLDQELDLRSVLLKITETMV